MTDLPSPVPPKPSVDDMIAGENHVEYEYAHRNDASGFSLTNMLNYARDNYKIVLPAAACFILVTGGITAAVLTPRASTKDTKEIAAEQKEELESEGVYGVDPEEYYAYDSDTTPGGSDSQDGIASTTFGDSTSDANYNTDSASTSTGSTSGGYGASKSSPYVSEGSKSRGSTGGSSTGSTPTRPSTGGGSPNTPTAPAPLESANMNVASWNSPYWQKNSDMTAGVRSLSESVDVLGMQEVGPPEKRDALKSLIRNCGSCGYALYMPDLNDGGNLPILWKKSEFKLISSGNMLVYEKQTAEYAAGGTKASRKNITWVRLQERKTGKMFYHVNLHFTPGYSKGGRPHPDRPKRYSLYKKHVTALMNEVESFRSNGTVFVTGDFNIDHKTDKSVQYPTMPYAQLKSEGLYASWSHLGYSEPKTHNGGYIDYVYMNKSSTAIPKSHKVMPKLGGDHSPIRMIVQLKG